MCGFAFISGYKDSYTSNISEILSALHHRGPDNSEFISQKRFSLGSCRLSIFDHSEKGKMPMKDKTGRYYIVYNGEIYNFKQLKKQFNISTVSETDTEVLLELFIKLGKKSLNYLNGIFSFIIYDQKNNSLFAARDRLGVKPFFYYHNSREFIISSEIKGILTQKQNSNISELNMIQVSTYLKTTFYDYGESTFYKNIKQLPQGHYFEYDIYKNKLDIKKYWDLNFNKKISNQNIYDQFEYDLLNSFKLQLGSDTDIAVNISSGIDSKLMVKVLKKLNLKKVIYNSYYFDSKQYSEKENLEEFAKKEDIEVNFFKITPEDIIKNFDEVFLSQDEPFPGVPTIAKHLLIKRSSQKKTKVILEAQGGDDFAGGYKYIFPFYLLSLSREKKYIKYINEFLFFMFKEKMSLLNMFKFINNSKKSFFEGGISADGSIAIEDIFTHNLNVDCDLLDNLNKIDNKKISYLKKIIYRDLFFCKLPRILRSCDRASMYNSKELRVPLLDHNIVEFFFNLEDDNIIRNGDLRYFYREFCKKKFNIKESFLKKIYVSDPQTKWIKNELYDWAYDNLSCKSFKLGEFVDQKKLLLSFTNFKNNKYIQNSNIYWQVINLQKLFSLKN
jgi:asparagine synthase (glutamine-hydrolysing)